MYIPSIFHFSIFTNPYSTFVYPMKSPGNPQEIPMKISMRHTKQWFGRTAKACGQGLSQHRRKQMGRVAKSVRRLRLGKKGDLSMECMDHVLQMDWLWLVMIGYDWVCLKKMAIIKKNWHLNPPSVMEIPMWGAQITWYFCCQMEYQGWRQLSGRSMSCCLDDPTAYILWFS